MTKRVYLDASVLIAAWRGQGDAGLAAIGVLDDPDLLPVVSDAVWLEVMPKPLYEQRHAEVAFYRAVFDRAEQLPWRLDTLRQAHDVAQRHGIAAMDAIHVACAIAADVDELVTGERPCKPLFRIGTLPIRSLRPEAP
jgi:predicted nucleic acid-binding protein